METKERTTVYLPSDLMKQARAYNINVSQAAAAGLLREVRKAKLMVEAEKKVEEELQRMEE